MDFHNGIPQCTVGEGLLRQNAIISSKDLQQKVEIRQKKEIHKKGNPQKVEIRQKREFHNRGIPQLGNSTIGDFHNWGFPQLGISTKRGIPQKVEIR